MSVLCVAAERERYHTGKEKKNEKSFAETMNNLKKKIIVAVIVICCSILYFTIWRNSNIDDDFDTDMLELKESGNPKRGGRNVLNWDPPENAVKELADEWNRAVLKARQDVANFDLGGVALRHMLKQTRNEMETLYRLLFGSGASRGEF